MKALILAAGYATRLYPLTIDRPKALLPIERDKPIINYLLDELATLEQLTEVHVISNQRFIEHFESWAQELREKNTYPGFEIFVWNDGTTSDEDKLGAIGDIQFVLDQTDIADDLFVAAADNFFTFPLKGFVEDFYHTQCDTICAALMEGEEDLKRMAIAKLDSERRVLNLEEKPEHPKSNLAVYALYMYRQDTLPLFKQYLQEGNSPDSPGNFPAWLYTRKEVRAYLFEGEMIDIGTPESYREAQERFA